MIPLHTLAIGEQAEVAEVCGQSAQVDRLEAMGIRQGAWVEMLQPGSPCIVRLAGSKLCFREADLFSILVRPGAFA